MKIKRTILIILACLPVTFVQAQSFVQGTNVIGAAIGIGSSIGGFGYSSETPALSVLYEKGIWEAGGPGTISLGGYVGFKAFKNSAEYTGGYSYTQKWQYTIIGVRSAYHYNGLSNDKVDLYGGLMLSYNILHYSYSDSNPAGSDTYDNGDGSSFGFTIYVGGRYYFSPNLAAFAELGYGVSFINLGLAYKF